MIAPRNWITREDWQAVANFLEAGGPLSGYLAGIPHGGAAVQRLEEMWCTKFGRQHAIAVNSATSGLLAACEAIDAGNKRLAVPALSMSATVAVPVYLGAGVEFMDVDAYGCADISSGSIKDAYILTSVFGCPVDHRWQRAPVILDNAQGICARVGDRWAEQLAAISVTSLNVHKQINAGEGGIISTDDDVLAATMRGFINHGENPWPGHEDIGGRGDVGLNLRMTELSAVLALSQMARIDQTINELNALCLALDHLLTLTPFTPLGVREGCYSARYCYAFRVSDGPVTRSRRDYIVDFLCHNGVPAIPMYRPLYELPAFAQYKRSCPVAEQMADSLVVLELCGWRYEDDLDTVARVLEKASKL